jgi:hypothetical protein
MRKGRLQFQGPERVASVLLWQARRGTFLITYDEKFPALGYRVSYKPIGGSLQFAKTPTLTLAAAKAVAKGMR